MSWAYRRGFRQQLARLERKRFLESQKPTAHERLHRLTEAGRLVALNGRDPEQAARRRWDGEWRLIVYDIPEKRTAERSRLRGALRELGFGYLQNSVWITPSPMHDILDQVRHAKVDVKSITCFQGRPCGGESDADIVRGAWNFDAINAAYKLHSKILADCPSIADPRADHWRKWFSRERQAWQRAMEIDPLLPSPLQPRCYRGRQAWQHRLEIMSVARRYLGQFKEPR